jgi:hypothetical protein
MYVCINEKIQIYLEVLNIIFVKNALIRKRPTKV